jgi:hypothetical protein
MIQGRTDGPDDTEGLKIMIVCLMKILKMAYGPPQTNFAGVPKNQKKGSCVSVLNIDDRLWTQRQTQTSTVSVCTPEERQFSHWVMAPIRAFTIVKYATELPLLWQIHRHTDIKGQRLAKVSGEFMDVEP